MSYDISPLSDLLYSVWHSLGPCCCKRHYFTLFNGWVIFHCVYIPRLLYPFLACFPILAIANSAARNIGVHISFQIMFFSRYMPRSEVVVPYGSSLSFLRNLHNFSIVAVPIYIPINNAAEKAMAATPALLPGKSHRQRVALKWLSKHKIN